MPRTDAPADFDADAVFAGVHWHQRWEIFPGVFVPGAILSISFAMRPSCRPI